MPAPPPLAMMVMKSRRMPTTESHAAPQFPAPLPRAMMARKAGAAYAWLSDARFGRLRCLACRHRCSNNFLQQL